MSSEKITTFLLGAITVLLAMIVFGKTPLQVERAMAFDKGGTPSINAEGILAIVGENNDLFLIDARNQRVAIYKYSKSSGRLMLKAARNFSHDIRVNKEIHSSKGLTYDEVKDLIEK